MTDQGCDVAPMDMSGDIEALVERVRVALLGRRHLLGVAGGKQADEGLAALTELAERARERDWIKERHGQQADRANALKAQRDELVETLERAESAAQMQERYSNYGDADAIRRDAIHAALAKVRGEAK